MCSILLLPLVARCLETIDVCEWRMFIYGCCSDYVGICGNVCCVAGVVQDSVFLTLECLSMLYVCIGDVTNVVFSVFIARDE